MEETPEARTLLDTCRPLSEYLDNLDTDNPTCDSGEPGVVTFAPDEDTPDVVYYQVSVHMSNIVSP